MKSIKSYIICSVIMVSILACSSKVKATDDTRYVKVVKISQAGASDAINTFNGVVYAKFEPSLSFRVAGKITARYVDIGNSVKKGQLLAKLDSSDYQLSEGSSTSQLASAKATYLQQKANLDRYTELLKQNFVSQASFDSQQSAFENAKAQYEQATNQLQNSKNQVKYTELTAPSDGVISSITMDAGQVVSAGQIVATMAVSGDKEVEIELPESLVNNYYVGESATIKLWASDKIYHGKIRAINQANNQQTRTFTARVSLLDADNSIKYGMSADVTIQTNNNSFTTQLPLSSIYAKDGKNYVWVLDSNNIVKLIEVKVIKTDGSITMVNGELTQGMNIVSAGVNFLHSGEKVNVYAN